MDTADETTRKRPRSSVQSRDRLESSAAPSGVESENGTLVCSKRSNPKANTACETCRMKKVKCNEGQPVCGYCSCHGFRCDYRQRPMSSKEQMSSMLLTRLLDVEEKLDIVLQFKNRLESHEAQFVKDAPLGNTPIAAVPSPTTTLDPHFQLPTDHAGQHLLLDSAVIIDNTVNHYDASATSTEETAIKLQYVEKTPFACEEARLPLPDLVSRTEPTKPSDISSFLEYFLEHPCPMYPVMCDTSAHSISGPVVTQGFREDIHSCFTLLIVALSKAYRDEESLESGVSDFQRATRLLARLSVQFSLQHVQAHVLSAIFLLKKGRLLDFWHSLHTGCTTLYMMIKRDQASRVERSLAESNNILRIYWICYNLERDLKNEIDDTLPRSPLYQLEDSLPLPLGCDESDLLALPVHARTTLTFFLAEMALKAIGDRILTSEDLDFCVQETEKRSLEISPLARELRRQLDGWLQGIPFFLGWSPEPTKGFLSPLGNRVKLMYWFVRFSLFRPLILHVLGDPSSPFPILAWTFFQEGLLAGLTLINVLILEESHIDVIMGNRILGAICLIKETFAEGYFPVVRDENISSILQAGIDTLWNRLGGKSEWIRCRLYGL